MLASDEELAVQAQSRVGTWLREKYRIDRVLGVGGMGAVYAATHRNGRQVAIKLLHGEYSVRADLRRRFLRESQAANAVNHPGVVAIIDDDVGDDGAAFLVMELLEGRTVEELWEANGRKLSPKAVLTIASDLCAVLAVAHAAGVVHRDLKPANLFITRGGDLKVLDFGIARVRDEAGPRATHTGSIMGTPAFMAPEQACGLIDEVGPLTDVWAVGATLFTLLTGRSVHEGRSAQHVAVLAATTPAPSLASVLDDAPHELVMLIDRALAFDKTNRWPTAAAFRTAITEVEAALSAQDAPVGEALSETMLAVAGVQPIRKGSGTLQSAGNPGVFGRTTGQPVSSNPVTEMENQQTFWRRFFAWVKAGETDADVSSDAPTRRRFSRRRRALVAAACIVPVLGVAVFAASHTGNHTSESSLATQASVSASMELPPPPEDPPRAASAPPTTSSTESAAREELRPKTTERAIASAAPAGNRPTRGITHQRPPQIASPKSTCDPPFTVQNGISVHKVGCP